MLNLPVIIIYPLKNLFVWSDKFLKGGNLFATPFNWKFGKIQFFEYCQREFNFCRHKIHYTTFASAFFCQCEIIWVRKTHRSWDFNQPMICQICDAMMSISTWNMVHFWKYLLSHNSLTHQTWSIDRYKQGQYFSEIFWIIWRTWAKLQTLFNLTTCSNYLITNYVKFPVFLFFWKGE